LGQKMTEVLFSFGLGRRIGPILARFVQPILRGLSRLPDVSGQSKRQPIEIRSTDSIHFFYSDKAFDFRANK